MPTPSTPLYVCDLFIGSNPRNWGDLVNKFEWQSFINNGFMIKGGIDDHGYDLLDQVFSDDGEGVFRKARQNQEPTVIRFRLRWLEGDSTPWRTALISDMFAAGRGGYGGKFEFIAVDPITYHLNNGDCNGGMWRGKVGGKDGVIMQVLEHYIPDTIKVPIVGNKPVGKAIRVERIVSPTTDEVANYWMMRQDPKTFIQSLLDWSCSFTENHTSWMVSNGETDDAISINVEEICTHDLHDPQGVGSSTGPLTFQYGPVQSGPSITNILKWDMLHDSFIVTLNSNLVTSGISAMSGEYFDRRVDPQRRTVYVNDDNTQNKVNPTFGKDRGYDKPRGDLQRGWTNITSIPEFHAGEIGYPYSKYIDGRARQTFMDMLNMVMRIKVTVVGEPRLFDL